MAFSSRRFREVEFIGADTPEKKGVVCVKDIIKKGKLCVI